MATYTPNSEQQAIIDATKNGTDGVIKAGAGTGKTTTLQMIAEANPDKKILYLAFNRKPADKAEAVFPKNCLCRNQHRLAYRPFAKQVQRRGNKYPSAKFVANALNIRPFSYQAENGESEVLAPRKIAVAVGETISRFCTSADREPREYHARWLDITKNLPENVRDQFLAHLLPYVRKAWDDIADPNGTLPFMPGRGDCCYLKLWSLSDPQLGFDLILYDEAQDAEPATAHVVEIQHCQKVMVGDSSQAIYGWRGAVDAMRKFQCDWHLPLTQSYRFGPAIAEQANRWLKHVPDADLEIVGFDKIESKVQAIQAPSAILCRTNAGCIQSALDAQENGQPVAIAGGTSDIEGFTKAANNLIQGIPTNHPELVSYDSWSDIQEAVKSGEASDLGMMVRLIDNYGTHAILEVCRNSVKVDEEQMAEFAAKGGVIVSTAHKAKGLEWDHVRIHSDFQAPKNKDDEGPTKISVTEAMLIYVAVTRAKQTLDNAALSWLDQLEADINEEMNKGEQES